MKNSIKIKTQPQNFPSRRRRGPATELRSRARRSTQNEPKAPAATISVAGRDYQEPATSAATTRQQKFDRGGVTMMLTRKSAGAPAHLSSSRLSRSLSGMLAKTIDRRAFLKRSGIAAGRGARSPRSCRSA